jgi:hypothetical protein
MIASVSWTLIISTFLAAISAIAAAITASFSYLSIKSSRAIAVEQRAAESIKQYLELAMQHPKLSSLTKADQYDWFVIFLLMTAHDVLEAKKENKSWKTFVEIQLDWFKNEIATWKKDDAEHKTNYLGLFGPAVVNAVNQALSKKAVGKAESA